MLFTNDMAGYILYFASGGTLFEEQAKRYNAVCNETATLLANIDYAELPSNIVESYKQRYSEVESLRAQGRYAEAGQKMGTIALDVNLTLLSAGAAGRTVLSKLPAGSRFAGLGIAEKAAVAGNTGKAAGTMAGDLAKIRLDLLTETAQAPYKGSTTIGHALSKHAGRNPDIWGKLTGPMTGWNEQAMTHLNSIIKAPGDFVKTTGPNGIGFLEKRLPDGRGIRLNMDGSFKGFLD